MRRLLLSAGLCAAACQGALAQEHHHPPGDASKDSASLPQIPFGQTYKQFQFPLYQNGELNATLAAVSARGVTVNRAETTDLKIDLYTDGKVTTTITSPLADLYVADRRMRTKNTVLVERADMEATAQTCDFDLLSKKYLLRQNVHVLLKNFDAGATSKPAAPVQPSTPAVPPAAPASDDTAPIAPSPILHPGDSLLDVPGASAATNSPPLSPSLPATP